jgi:type VI secretion system secreted protein VgrG
VYFFATSAFLTGTLTLDAQGNPDALFVFQIGSTLTTATGSSVLLTGGATAAQVYWDVGSSATLGGSTAFKGTILADQSISLGSGATILDGRALALNGAVTMIGNSIVSPGVPEPSSWAMLLLGFAGLGVARLRRPSRAIPAA